MKKPVYKRIMGALIARDNSLREEIEECMEQKLFKVLSGNEDVLGGPVEYENVYISVYPVLLDIKDEIGIPQKPISKLEIGEWSLVTFSLCGEVGTYRILRVQ